MHMTYFWKWHYTQFNSKNEFDKFLENVVPILNVNGKYALDIR